MHFIQRKQFSETNATSHAFQQISDLKIFLEWLCGPLKTLWRATCGPRACSLDHAVLACNSVNSLRRSNKAYSAYSTLFADGKAYIQAPRQVWKFGREIHFMGQDFCFFIKCLKQISLGTRKFRGQCLLQDIKRLNKMSLAGLPACIGFKMWNCLFFAIWFSKATFDRLFICESFL